MSDCKLDEDWRQDHPVLLAAEGRLWLFAVWAAGKPRRGAVWATTALFGGVGCSVLHVHNPTQAALTYLLGLYVALVVMLPWFIAEYRLNGGCPR